MKETFKSSKIPAVKFYDKVSHRTYEILKRNFMDVEQILNMDWMDSVKDKDKNSIYKNLWYRHLNILVTLDGHIYYVSPKDFNKIITSVGLTQGYSEKALNHGLL